MRTTLLVAMALMFVALLPGQDEGKPLTLGGFENQGSATFGYRLTDINGYQPMYNELFNLRSGFRLMDLDLFAKTKDGSSRFMDSYSLTTNGVGGEPFTNVQLTVGKTRLYELRATFRQSYYYWDRNDAAIAPGGVPGLTSNHNWATVRKLGLLNLLVHASDRLSFSFDYFRNSRDGVTFTTRSLDYFGSSTTWGAFARANPFYMVAPVNELTDRAAVGVNYSKENWFLHYRLGYQTFSDAVNGNNAGSPERSINRSDPTTAMEPLTVASWIDSRRLTTPVSEFSYNGHIVPKLEARGGYIFYRYSGPASLNMSMNGLARTNTAGTVDAPYFVTLSTTAHVTEPNHILDQGLTYHISDWWNLMADYRYSRFSVDSSAIFNSVAGSTVSNGLSQNQWRIGTSSLDLGMTFAPVPSLLLKAGVRLMKSDVLVLEDGVADSSRTKRLKSAWPVGSFYYQPSKMLTIRGDADQITTGTSYTRLSPHTDVGGRFVVRFRPSGKFAGFYLEDTGVFRNRNLLAASYRNTVRSNATTANYEFNEKFTIFGGIAYDSFFATDVVSFLRGTAPFTNLTIADQTVSRVWQGGLKLNPSKRLGMNFAGNFVRTTGLGQIAGETPIYGPMSFPYATGSIYYDLPRVGRWTLQLQRTYYAEQIVTGNNFSANLLTILYTRSF